MNAALATQSAMRNALLVRVPLNTLLGGGHVFDEVPRGANAPYIAFNNVETRDWSVADQKAHEHFITLEVNTNSRSRSAAQNIVDEIEQALDNANLTLTDHKLINLRVIFTTVLRNSKTDNFGALIRFRAATEPL
jgi:Protein of unknown function (DUF3168)